VCAGRSTRTRNPVLRHHPHLRLRLRSTTKKRRRMDVRATLMMTWDWTTCWWGCCSWMDSRRMGTGRRHSMRRMTKWGVCWRRRRRRRRRHRDGGPVPVGPKIDR
jgi:hypothetical protein